MPPAGFEPLIATSESPHTHPLDHGATGIGEMELTVHYLRKRAQPNLDGTWASSDNFH
jgi:hypothetical protein